MSDIAVYLVDGYNVIRRVERFRRIERSLGLEAGREALVRAIQESRLLRRSRVVAVFDGSGEGPVDERAVCRGLTVRFSRPPQSADALILSLLSAAASVPTAVVTEDRELAWEARRSGASAISPSEWCSRLSPSPPRRKFATEEEPGKPAPTRSEVDWGLAVFGEETASLPGSRRRKPSETAVPPDRSAEERHALKERRRARYLKRTGRRR